MDAPPLPKGIEVDATPGRFSITLAWWSTPKFTLSASLLVGSLGMTVAATQSDVYPVLATATSALIVVTLAIYSVAIARNTTRIDLVGTALRLRHGPVPWPGLVFPVRQLDQLFVMAPVISNEPGGQRYKLVAQLHSGAQEILVEGLLEPVQALYLEAVLEKQLGIVDREVPGEVAKR